MNDYPPEYWHPAETMYPESVADYSSRGFLIASCFTHLMGMEPIHIRVARDRGAAKFWLELRDIEKIVHENQLFIVRSWNEFFAC